MNAAEVIRRLWKEKKQWEYDQAGGGPEIKWVIKGIEIALGHVRAIVREKRQHAAIRRPPISRWFAADLAHAIDIALRLLDRADRGKAIEVLKRAQNLVKNKGKGL